MAKSKKTSKSLVPVSLSVKPGFTGMVVVRLENGIEKAQFPLRSGEFIGSLESFIDAVKTAGYQVIPPATQG